MWVVVAEATELHQLEHLGDACVTLVTLDAGDLQGQADVGLHAAPVEEHGRLEDDAVVAVDARLVQVERVALTKGFAVTMGRPIPVISERLHAWASNLEGRGLTLAPITAVARLAEAQ